MPQQETRKAIWKQRPVPEPTEYQIAQPNKNETADPLTNDTFSQNDTITLMVDNVQQDKDGNVTNIHAVPSSFRHDQGPLSDRPTCDADHRGQTYLEHDSVDDTLYVCMRKGGAFTWLVQ